MRGSSNRARIAPASDPIPTAELCRALVQRVEESGHVVVRLREGRGGPALLSVGLAWIAGYIPTAGDEVRLAKDGDEWVVIGVISSARPVSLVGGDGAHVELSGAAMELKDRVGRLLLRYERGALEIAPATGDLRLRAPSGGVHIEAQSDVSIDASRAVLVDAAGSAEISAGARREEARLRLEEERSVVSAVALEVRARVALFIGSRWDLVAAEVRTRAERIEIAARSLEMDAERSISRVKQLARHVAGPLDIRAGRVRSVVEEEFAVQSESVEMTSDHDTSIDGRRVLLG